MFTLHGGARLILAIALILGLIGTQAVGLTVDVSSSNSRDATEMSTNYDTTINDFVDHEITLAPQEGGISNHQHGTGGFTKSIISTDTVTGNIAQSYAKVVASDPGRPITEYWSEVNAVTGAGQTNEWLTVQNAKSISAYSKAYSPDGNNLAQSSVSINPSIASPTTLASLDYSSWASIDFNVFLSGQDAYPGRSGAGGIDPSNPPSSLANGASGDRVIFTETSYNGAGDYAVSKLDAKDANVPYYEGHATTGTGAQTESSSQTNAGVTNPAAGSISAYSQALDDYVKATGAYSNLAKSSASLTSSTSQTATLDYQTLATSNHMLGTLDTFQQTHQDADSYLSPPPGTYGAKGNSITLAETSYNRLSGTTNNYASSLLTANRATVFSYEGSATTTDSKANVETKLPSDTGGHGVQSSQSITYQTYAKNIEGKYALSSASVTGSQMNGPAYFPPFGKASSQGSAVESSINNLVASGKTISVTSDQSDGDNRYYLTSYASGNTDHPIAQYSGNVTSTMGIEAKQQISTLDGFGTVYLKDYRKKGDNIQYATLYPIAKSFTGTAVSKDTGQIIQDNVNRASSSNKDTLYLSAGTFNENVVIDKSLNIYGAGNTIVDGQHKGSVFTVGNINPNAVVTLSSMKIQNGNATNGGGIYNKGKLTVTGSTISGNTATNYGGGIYSEGTSTVTVTGSTISGNKATAGGGGIENWGNGKLTVTGSTVSGNTAAFFGGGISNEGGTVTVKGSTINENNAHYGGGIFNNGGTLAVKDASTISGNTATNYGGGIYSEGTSTVAVTGSTISGNTAYWGGGINNNFGTLTVTGSTISGNKATAGGGGIENWGNGKLTVTGSTVSGNTAIYGGGIENSDGTITVTGSTISGNTATQDGGGIYNVDKLTVAGSTISGNKATTLGGGICNSGGTATVTVTGSTISNNHANWGGGINNCLGTAKVTGSILSGNAAGTGGGGILNWGGGTATVTDSILSGNTAGDYGGGIGNEDASTMNVLSSVISGNTAANNGGGIYNRNKLFVRGTSWIKNNQATTGYGGGIYSTTNSVTFDGTGVAVKSNKAHLPDTLPVGTPWYQGWGVYLTTGTTPTTTGGFNPATQVTGNTHI